MRILQNRIGSRLCFGSALVGVATLIQMASAKSPAAPTLTIPTNNQNNNNNQQQPTPPPDNPALREAAHQVDLDRQEVTKAEAALAKVANPLREAFAKSPEMTAAAAAVQDAQKSTKAAEAAVLASLANNPAFQAASKKKADAVEQVHKLRAAGASHEELAAAAAVVMDAGAVATKMQADAERADPTLVQCRKDSIAADAKISELQKQNQESLRNNPQWIAAKKTVDDAKAKLAASQAALAAVPRQ